MPSPPEGASYGLFAPLEKALWLHRLCESNFVRLQRLLPDLATSGQSHFVAWSKNPDRPALRAEIVERSVFTVDLELSHDFGTRYPRQAEPRARIRVSLDAKTAEMLSDQDRPQSHTFLGRHAPPSGILDYKWDLNYFLMRWLVHFESAEYVPVRPAERLTSSMTRSP